MQEKLTVYDSNPVQLISKAFLLEPNPYKFWKILQDAKGPLFFKDVFLN